MSVPEMERGCAGNHSCITGWGPELIKAGCCFAVSMEKGQPSGLPTLLPRATVFPHHIWLVSNYGKCVTAGTASEAMCSGKGLT